jgi:hypothetical protein
MRRLVPLAAILLCFPAPARAQADWTTAHQGATWLNAFADHKLADRTALWLDVHWRRMDFGAPPQQFLLRPGLQYALSSAARVGGGYAYIATAPYGESPNPNPTREHRLWQQATFAQAVGGAAVSHRVRWEQRWIAPLVDGSLEGLRYQQRLRYAVRAQRSLRSATVGGRPMLGFVANEFFLPVGHSDGEQRRLQNRAQLGVGIALSDAQRVEIGYLHQWNRITPRTTHEHNHTLVMSWVWTAR